MFRYAQHDTTILVLRTAAALANEVIKIFLAVVVRELFAGLDVATRVDEDFVPNDFDLAVRATRVVDVPRNICSSFSVDRSAVFEIE